MTRGIPLGWPGLIGKCRSIFPLKAHRPLTGRSGIMKTVVRCLQNKHQSRSQSPCYHVRCAEWIIGPFFWFHFHEWVPCHYYAVKQDGRLFAELFRNCTSEETSVPWCSSHLSYKRKWFQFLLALLRPASTNCPCTGSPRMPRMTSQYLANLTAPFQSIYLSHRCTNTSGFG